MHGLLVFHFVEILHYNLNYFLIHYCENPFNTERLNNPVNTQTTTRWRSIMTLGLSVPHSHTLWCVPTHWRLLMWLRDQQVNINTYLWLFDKSALKHRFFQENDSIYNNSLSNFPFLFTLPLNTIKLKKKGYKSKVLLWHLNLPTEEVLVWIPVTSNIVHSFSNRFFSF